MHESWNLNEKVGGALIVRVRGVYRESVQRARLVQQASSTAIRQQNLLQHSSVTVEAPPSTLHTSTHLVDCCSHRTRVCTSA